MGRHAGRHPWWTPVRVVLLLAAVCVALGMVQKTDCFQEGWSSGTTRYSDMCYSDLPYLYTGRGLVELAWPFTDDPQVRARFEVMEYPVGISYWAYGAAWATHWLSGSPDLETALRSRIPARCSASPTSSARSSCSSSSTPSASLRSRCSPRGSWPASTATVRGTRPPSRSRRPWRWPGSSTGT